MIEIAGDQYEVLIAGDIDRDGQFIEAWQGGCSSEGKQVASLFAAYESDKMTFWCADEVPLRLVQELIATAIERRHAENTYKFLLRKV